MRPYHCSDILRAVRATQVGENGPAADEFKIIGTAQIDEVSRHIIEQSQECVNRGAKDVRDRTPINLRSLGAEEMVDRLNNVAWNNPRYCDSWRR